MSIWNRWKEKLKSAVNTIKNNVSGTVSNIKNGISNTVSKVQNWINGAKNSTANQSTSPTVNTDATTAATATDLKQKTEATKEAPQAIAANPQTTPTPTTTPTSQTQDVKSNALTGAVGMPNPAVMQTVGLPAPTPEPIKADIAVAPEQEQPIQPEQPAQPEQTQPAGGEDRFLQWYKSQFGKDYTEGSFNKAEGMSDKDYETGNNLYQAYVQKQNLENQYNSGVEDINDSKAQQRQEASILRDKMAKYLNLQNKNNGLDNLGVSQSVGLQADANYMNNLGSIETEANKQKTSLLNNYMNQKSNLESDAAANEQSILNKYQQYEREDEQKAYDRQQDEYNKKKYEDELAYQKEQDAYNKQKYEDEQAYKRQQDEYERQKYEEELAYQKQQDEYNKNKTAQDAAYNEFMATIESGTFNTAAELQEFYNTFKDRLSPAQQAIAEQQIRFYKNNPDQQELDKETEDRRTGVISEKENEDGTKTTVTRDEDGNETTVTTDKNGEIIDTKREDSAALAEKKEAEKTERILAGKEYIQYGGKEYQLKSQLGTNANELRNNNSFTEQLKKTCGTSNPFDSNIPDGTTFEIKVDAAGKDNPSAWNWIAGILTVGMSELAMGSIYRKNVTYYKGNWYVSEKK